MNIVLLTTTISLGIICLISGCSLNKKTPSVPFDTFSKAGKIKSHPKPVKLVKLYKPLPLPGQLKPVPKKKENSARSQKKTIPIKTKINEANKKARFEPEKDGYINAIQVYPYVQGALYRLYAAVNQISDIALQPGEKLHSVSAGDTVRWIVGDTKSGSGQAEQVHILVKPVAADLQTNLVINTDRRTYHLELLSHQQTAMASLSWTYPKDNLISLQKRNSFAKTIAHTTIDDQIALKKLNFRYTLKGKAPWKPVRVFDDSSKVYIQFPSGIKQGDAPPLFILGHKSKLSLVNYRMKHNYYVVDRLFAAAELRHGEDPQHVVRITRTDATWK